MAIQDSEYSLYTLEQLEKIINDKRAIEAESNVFSDPETKKYLGGILYKCIECDQLSIDQALCEYCEWLVYEGPNGVKI